MQTTNNLGRRIAFRGAFHAYPAVLRGFAKSAGLGHAGEKTADREEAAHTLLNSPTWPIPVLVVLPGIFALQLLATRARMEKENGGDPAELENYVKRANFRLLDLAGRELRGFDLQAADVHAKALRAFQEQMASIVFDSLAVDAQSRLFDEPGFWADVFRSLGDTDASGAIVRGLSAVVLDRLDELRHALRVTEGGHVLDLQAAATH